MMKIIRRHKLDNNIVDTQSIYLPSNSEILTVDFDKELGLVLFVMSPRITDGYALRYFKVYVTNETIYDSNILKYIGTCSTDEGIRHVLELKQ